MFKQCDKMRDRKCSGNEMKTNLREGREKGKKINKSKPDY